MRQRVWLSQWDTRTHIHIRTHAHMHIHTHTQAHELEGLAITMGDFETAVGKVQPSVRREGFATTPDVTWEDVGSLDEVGVCVIVCVCECVCVRMCVWGFWCGRGCG